MPHLLGHLSDNVSHHFRHLFAGYRPADSTVGNEAEAAGQEGEDGARKHVLSVRWPGLEREAALGTVIRVVARAEGGSEF